MSRDDRLFKHLREAQVIRLRIYEIEREISALRYQVDHFDERNVSWVGYDHVFFQDQTDLEWRAAYERIDLLAAEQYRLLVIDDTKYSAAAYLRVASESRFLDIDQPEIYIAISSIAIASVIAYYIYSKFTESKEIGEPAQVDDMCLICDDEGPGSCWFPFILMNIGYVTGGMYAFLELKLF